MGRTQRSNHSTTITFTNETGLCGVGERKRIMYTFIGFGAFAAILGLCVYQLKYGEVGVSSRNDDKSLDVSEDQLGLESQQPHLLSTLNNYRLPKALKPFYYQIHLVPEVSPETKFSLTGKVQIHLRCQYSTDRVTVNIKNISIDESSVRIWQIEGHETQNFTVIGHEYDSTRDLYTCILKPSLDIGSSYAISIDYEGKLGDELVGFYRSSYVDKKTNETRWLAVTQFSPTDARRALPSFDEPEYKAEFVISIARPSHMTSLSNMNLLFSEQMPQRENWVIDNYAKTLPVSTYLVGFAVTDFVYRNGTGGRTPFRIWAREDAIEQTAYAATIGPKILDHFVDYFGIPFPLPKQDMIGVPDHRFNAMENWGMITYRELAIFYDANYSADSNKLRIAEVVAHELAHQWFGNLVTPAWWSDLWLKEGFASYMEYIGIDHVEPEWKTLDLFVLNEMQKVFRMDALNNSHPVSVPVENPNEINRIFDDISYSKGATIIRMMDHFLTSATFKKGLTNYLNKWKFNNTEQGDLWSSLTAQAHFDGTLDPALSVSEIMDTWTLQKGFPVVNVHRRYGSSEVFLEQKKFSLIPETENSGYQWFIPISVASSVFNEKFSVTQPLLWIYQNESRIERDLGNEVLPDDDTWLIVNVESTSYYRVNYDLTNWALLGNELLANHKQIHVVNRAQLLDDSFTLARANLLPYEMAFNLSLYLSEDTEHLPWVSFLNSLDYLADQLRLTPIYDLFSTYVLSLVEFEYTRVNGFQESPTDTFLEKAHRLQILKWACDLGHMACINEAVRLYSNLMENSHALNTIPPNFRQIIYCTAIKHGSRKEWEFAKEKYLKIQVAAEQDRILTALACSQDEAILRTYLNEAVRAESFVRKQDSRNVLHRVAQASHLGSQLTFSFLQKEWIRISKYLGAGLSIKGIINEGIAPKLKTIVDVAKLERFKKDYSGHFGFGEVAVDEAIEIVNTNVHWNENSHEAVTAWLEKFSGKSYQN